MQSAALLAVSESYWKADATALCGLTCDNGGISKYNGGHRCSQILRSHAVCPARAREAHLGTSSAADLSTLVMLAKAVGVDVYGYGYVYDNNN